MSDSPPPVIQWTPAQPAPSDFDRDVVRRLKDLEKFVSDLKANLVRPYILPWTTWAPVVNQSGARASTVNWARYTIWDKLCVVQVKVTITAAGSAGNVISVSGFPAAIQHIRTDAEGAANGSFIYHDIGTAVYAGVTFAAGADSLVFQMNPPSGLLGVSPSMATANGDELSFVLTYEIA